MENKISKIGVFTSGGDAPGMNAALRAVVRRRRKQSLGIRFSQVLRPSLQVKHHSGMVYRDYWRSHRSTVIGKQNLALSDHAHRHADDFRRAVIGRKQENLGTTLAL